MNPKTHTFGIILQDSDQEGKDVEAYFRQRSKEEGAEEEKIGVIHLSLKEAEADLEGLGDRLPDRVDAIYKKLPGAICTVSALINRDKFGGATHLILIYMLINDLFDEWMEKSIMDDRDFDMLLSDFAVLGIRSSNPIEAMMAAMGK